MNCTKIIKFQNSFLQRRARYNKDLLNVLLQFTSGVILKNALRPCRVSYYKLQGSNILTFFSKLHILHVFEFLLLSYSIKVVDQIVEKFSADIDTLDLWILLVVKYFWNYFSGSKVKRTLLRLSLVYGWFASGGDFSGYRTRIIHQESHRRRNAG